MEQATVSLRNPRSSTSGILLTHGRHAGLPPACIVEKNFRALVRRTLG
jgi:hypothetical protein